MWHWFTDAHGSASPPTTSSCAFTMPITRPRSTGTADSCPVSRGCPAGRTRCSRCPWLHGRPQKAARLTKARTALSPSPAASRARPGSRARRSSFDGNCTTMHAFTSDLVAAQGRDLVARQSRRAARDPGRVHQRGWQHLVLGDGSERAQVHTSCTFQHRRTCSRVVYDDVPCAIGRVGRENEQIE